MKKKILFILGVLLMLTACGPSKKVVEDSEKENFVPTHPPVIVPHQWTEGR